MRRVEQVLRDAAVKRADANLVVHVDAGRAAPDGVDARQVRRRALQRIVDAVEVILGIGLAAGVPGHFLAEDHFAVDDGRGLAVARAQIEADAAAFEMPAERGDGFALLGHAIVIHVLDRRGAAVDALAHEADSRTRAGRRGSRRPGCSARCARRRRSGPCTRPSATAGISAGARRSAHSAPRPALRAAARRCGRRRWSRRRARERWRAAVPFRTALARKQRFHKRGGDEAGVQNRTETGGYSHG